MEETNNTPSSKTTAAVLAAAVMSLIVTAEQLTGFDIPISEAILFWIATGVVGLASWYKSERNLSRSAIETIKQSPRKYGLRLPSTSE